MVPCDLRALPSTLWLGNQGETDSQSLTRLLVQNRYTIVLRETEG